MLKFLKSTSSHITLLLTAFAGTAFGADNFDNDNPMAADMLASGNQQTAYAQAHVGKAAGVVDGVAGGQYSNTNKAFRAFVNADANDSFDNASPSEFFADVKDYMDNEMSPEEAQKRLNNLGSITVSDSARNGENADAGFSAYVQDLETIAAQNTFTLAAEKNGTSYDFEAHLPEMGAELATSQTLEISVADGLDNNIELALQSENDDPKEGSSPLLTDLPDAISGEEANAIEDGTVTAILPEVDSVPKNQGADAPLPKIKETQPTILSLSDFQQPRIDEITKNFNPLNLPQFEEDGYDGWLRYDSRVVNPNRYPHTYIAQYTPVDHNNVPINLSKGPNHTVVAPTQGAPFITIKNIGGTADNNGRAHQVALKGGGESAKAVITGTKSSKSTITADYIPPREYQFNNGCDFFEFMPQPGDGLTLTAGYAQMPNPLNGEVATVPTTGFSIQKSGELSSDSSWLLRTGIEASSDGTGFGIQGARLNETELSYTRNLEGNKTLTFTFEADALGGPRNTSIGTSKWFNTTDPGYFHRVAGISWGNETKLTAEYRNFDDNSGVAASLSIGTNLVPLGTGSDIAQDIAETDGVVFAEATLAGKRQFSNCSILEVGMFGRVAMPIGGGLTTTTTGFTEFINFGESFTPPDGAIYNGSVTRVDETAELIFGESYYIPFSNTVELDRVLEYQFGASASYTYNYLFNQKSLSFEADAGFTQAFNRGGIEGYDVFTYDAKLGPRFTSANDAFTAKLSAGITNFETTGRPAERGEDIDRNRLYGQFELSKQLTDNVKLNGNVVQFIGDDPETALNAFLTITF